MKNFIEVIKTNKKTIITKGIVILASVGGLLVTAAILGKNNETDEDEDEVMEFDETEEIINVESTEE
jgi:hypothetical protein